MLQFDPFRFLPEFFESRPGIEISRIATAYRSFDLPESISQACDSRKWRAWEAILKTQVGVREFRDSTRKARAASRDRAQLADHDLANPSIQSCTLSSSLSLRSLFISLLLPILVAINLLECLNSSQDFPRMRNSREILKNCIS